MRHVCCNVPRAGECPGPNTGTNACFRWTEETPWGWTDENLQMLLETVGAKLGDGGGIEAFAPSPRRRREVPRMVGSGFFASALLQRAPSPICRWHSPSTCEPYFPRFECPPW